VVAVIGPVGRAVVVVCFAQDEDVIAATERILEDRDGTKINIGIMTRRLVGGGAIEIPDPELTDVSDYAVDGLRAGGERGVGMRERGTTHGGL
jgi:hypothetical protein